MKLATLKDITIIFNSYKLRNIYFKLLKANDNSKNQIYLGSNFSSLQVFRNLKIQSGFKNDKILKAPLIFNWITESGALAIAPNAQLIFYPQYPEVRLSGFLKGCKEAPSSLMNLRQTGRVLIWGINEAGDIAAIVLDPSHTISRQLIAKIENDSVIQEFTQPNKRLHNKKLLLSKLLKIHKEDWIPSIRLNGLNEIRPCTGTNCGGYTLEAKLGVKNNAISEPDFLGWEIKQFAVGNFENPSGGAVTLFTPEPDSGIYTEKGAGYFIRTYGYPDKSGKAHRINFSSPHKFNIKNPNTKLTLILDGYEPEKNRITNINGGIILLDEKHQIAAQWNFKSLMSHWNRKHKLAAYVPSLKRTTTQRIEYRYSQKIFLGEETDFLLFLSACSKSQIVYDPGIKLELRDGVDKIKKRSQFRIAFKAVRHLYKNWTETNL